MKIGSLVTPVLWNVRTNYSFFYVYSFVFISELGAGIGQTDGRTDRETEKRTGNTRDAACWGKAAYSITKRELAGSNDNEQCTSKTC